MHDFARKWRLIENEWNLKGQPWSGAVGIEEDDESLAVPALVCWFMRGIDPAIPQQVVDAHNAVIDATIHKPHCAMNNAPALPPGPCDCGADMGRVNTELNRLATKPNITDAERHAFEMSIFRRGR